MAEKQKNPQGITPAGSAKYPRLNQPDTKFNKSGIYSVKLIIAAEDAAPLQEAIEAVANKAMEDTTAQLETKLDEAKPKDKPKAKIALDKLTLGDMPFAPEYNDEGEETGNVEFSFKTNATYKDKAGKEQQRTVTMFDAKGKKLEGKAVPSVWGGSVLKVAYMLAPYYNAATNSVGCSPRLNAVQILELVSGSGGTAASYGFGEEDGYSAPEEAEEETFGGAGGGAEEDDF